VNGLLNGQTENDSLAKYSYEELEKKFYDTRFINKDLCKLYADKYFSKAKLDGDKIKFSRGYYQMAIFYYVVSDKDLNSLKYTDSIIHLCKDCIDIDFPALGYYTKGAYLYDLGKEKKALNNFLEALGVLKINNNVRLELKTRNAIISTKANWQTDDESLKYLLELLIFLKKQANYKVEYNEEYAQVIYNLSNEYGRLGNHLKQLEFAKLGIVEKFTEIRNPNYFDFVSSAGAAQFYLGNYQAAIDSCLKALPYEIKINDAIMDYYYLGKSYDKLHKKEKAHNYFLAVDSIYQADKDVYPELLSAYEHIIEYYKNKNDLENQIKYYDRSIEVDKIIDSTYTYVTETVDKKFDTPQAIAERNRLVAEAKAKESTWKYGFGIIATALLILLGVLITLFRRQKRYKQRFENIMSVEQRRSASKVTNTKEATPKNDLGVPQEIVANILAELKKFESSEKFTKQLSLTELAKKLGTNPKYLSKVINGHYQKNFSSYINELRIEYVISKLKSDAKFRNYTIKAISKEAGFGNTESFSKAFHKTTGIYPSYFIKQLQKRFDN
jgi:AraC-like DNA-binding protein